MIRAILIVWSVVAALVPGVARPATATLAADKDNSIFEDHPTNSGGGGPGIFSGTNGNNSQRRALIAFDIVRSDENPDGVPVGSTITGVELRLHLGNAPNSDAHDIGLHRLNQDWGEGVAGSTSQTIMMTGQGFSAGEGDATWSSAAWNGNPTDDVPWTGPGAQDDFNSIASATATVTGPFDSPTPFVWGSTQALVSDVQTWLDAPASNFGWIMINADEDITRSIKAFYSREATRNSTGAPNSLDPTWRPRLTVTYSTTTLPSGDYNGNGFVDAADYVVWRNTFGATAIPAGIGADGNQSGTIDEGDYAYWRSKFGNSAGNSLAAGEVPEPTCCILSLGAGLLAYLRQRR